MLKNKKILLCVTGSIAIYKALELTRLYIKAGANVYVLMSESAKKFITPLSFEAISGNEVLHEVSESWANKNNHIHITKDVDIVVVAPATANTINKIAYGIADTLLTQTLLANTKPLLIAPAANTIMYEHETTQNALQLLSKRGVRIIEPIEKLLACLDKGKGALAEIESIFIVTCKELMKENFWLNKHVLITGGGTKEVIDSVRYIGNYSSGKMAEALAKAFFLKGAQVTLISSAKLHDNYLPIKYINYENSQELKNELIANTPHNEYLFMVAAVSDYIPKKRYDTKLKKESIGKEWHLELMQNIDILKSIKTDKIKKIGFKAEVDEKVAYINAQKMLKNKNLDAVCLNIINKDIPFGGDENKITFITETSKKTLELNTKINIALDITKLIKSL